jgi:alkylation response protein AidB-like acyl-CoA dehydrogenase
MLYRDVGLSRGTEGTDSIQALIVGRDITGPRHILLRTTR